MKIQFIEDEVQLSKSILSYLKDKRYSCDLAEDFSSAQEKLEFFNYDCILLDITFSDGNDLNLLKFLKKENKSDDVIILLVKNSLYDKINGL